MEETPRKSIEEKEPGETGVKAGEESHYHEEQPEERQPSTEDVLNNIEKEIEEIGDRLAAIKEEKARAGEGSEEYNGLQDERKVLRKEIIDLDYHHKMTIIQRTKDRQQQDQQQKALQEQQKAERKQEEEKEEQKEKKAEGERAAEASVATARYEARIREMEAELAVSRLRRSRQIQLQADLIAIRSVTPYYWWRYYDSPLSYRPYLSYAYPLYSYPYSLYYPYGLYP